MTKLIDVMNSYFNKYLEKPRTQSYHSITNGVLLRYE